MNSDDAVGSNSRLRAAIAAGAWTVLLALLGCEREMRRFDTPPAPPSGASAPLQLGSLRAGPPASAASAAATAAAMPGAVTETTRNPYEDNAYDVAEGKRLFGWFNCSGCHGAGGGGGMGPALIDSRWIYGAEPANIVATVLQGRPNGMPAFAGRLSDEQVWQIAAYVRSMSGQLRTDVAPGRKDGISTLEPELRREQLEPKTVIPPRER